MTLRARRANRSAVTACLEKRNILHFGSLFRIAIAASIPVMPGMTTSAISISGWKLSSNSTACSPLNGASLEPCVVVNDRKSVRNQSLIASTITPRLDGIGSDISLM
jgi:hypothetical protein